MNLSEHREKLCLRLDIPREIASQCASAPDEVSSRHDWEKGMQALFYSYHIPAFVTDGSGSLTDGRMFISTDDVPRASSAIELYLMLQTPDNSALKEHCTLALWEESPLGDWRTVWPHTTRPFYTRLHPERAEQLQELGRKRREALA